jgi:hypothetical protein
MRVATILLAIAVSATALAPDTALTRRAAFSNVAAASCFQKALRVAAATGAASLIAAPHSASAEVGEKLRNLSPDKIGAIVKADLVERQFLATAAFTREIYDEAALFTDEIDTYTLPKFIKGTSALFVADKSKVFLVGDVEATEAKVAFRFDEDLCFNIPFQPVVTVTGRCELTRDPASGLITQYREYWDKTPGEVVLTAFQKKPVRT